MFVHRVTPRTLSKTLLAFALATVVSGVSIALAQSRPSDLFQKLQVTESSDQAAQQLVLLGKSGGEARAYIASHLPAVIEQKPEVFSKPWENAVRVAGELKIAEACSALGHWVGADNMGPNEVTLAEVERLATDPPAKSLAQIGDASIPTLVTVLHSEKVLARRDAILALRLIGSPQSLSALHDRATHETDPELQKLISRILSTKRNP
jgi:hypothetical protein